MIRCFRYCLILGLVLFGFCIPALAGIDRGYSKEENKKSWGEIVSWVFGGKKLGKAHALIVGVSEYRNFQSLESTTGDPERMRDFLLHQAGFDYVHVLTDEKVTRDRLRTLIQDEFRKRVRPNDRFVLYWSGHGLPVEANSKQLGYLPLTDSIKDSIASMLAMRELLGWADHVEAKQALHVLDTCFSGLASLPETLNARRDMTVELLDKPARHLFTATTGPGLTIASREWAGGIFTESFIAGASGRADRSGDGIVSMLELEEFVRDRVHARRSESEWPDVIKPRSYDLGTNEGEFFFVTEGKKREVAQVDSSVSIEQGMPTDINIPPLAGLATTKCNSDADKLFWESIKDESQPKYFEAYLERVKAGSLCGLFEDLARFKLDEMDPDPEIIEDRPEVIEVQITPERMQRIQQMLINAGFEPGRSDGILDQTTKSAIAQFQQSIDVEGTGNLNLEEEIELAFVSAVAQTSVTQFADTPTPESGWSPNKPVEFVVMAGSGGGADQIARRLQGLIEQKGLSPKPFVPVNKPGGSGAEALAYMKSKAGDDHTILVTLNSFYTTPIIQEDLGINVNEFTPIGRMALDNFLLWVNASHDEITDLDSYVAAVSAKGKDWNVGGTGSGQEDSILTAMMEAEFGYDVTYIPFEGGGKVAAALVGEQVDSAVSNPAEQNEFMRAGDTKPIVQFTAERMEAYPDIPTAKELGHDIEYYMQRSINGPPGMSDEAREWYINLFKTLYESEEWQQFCVDDGLFCDEWVAGADLATFHAAQLERHKKLIDVIGADAIVSE